MPGLFHIHRIKIGPTPYEKHLSCRGQHRCSLLLIASQPGRMRRIAYIQDDEALKSVSQIGPRAHHLHAHSPSGRVEFPQQLHGLGMAHIQHLQARLSCGHIEPIFHHLQGAEGAGRIVRSHLYRICCIFHIDGDDSSSRAGIEALFAGDIGHVAIHRHLVRVAGQSEGAQHLGRFGIADIQNAQASIAISQVEDVVDHRHTGCPPFRVPLRHQRRMNRIGDIDDAQAVEAGGVDRIPHTHHIQYAATAQLFGCKVMGMSRIGDIESVQARSHSRESVASVI